MSIIIVGVGPAEFDGKQGEDHVHVCAHAFVSVCACVYLHAVILRLHSSSYLASHMVQPFFVHIFFFYLLHSLSH